MARPFADLVSWFRRETSVPEGAVPLTGTAIVPADDFTLTSGDEIVMGGDGHPPAGQSRGATEAGAARGCAIGRAPAALLLAALIAENSELNGRNGCRWRS
jgi:hypothetical protein